MFYLMFVVRSGFSVSGRPFFSLFDDGMISMRFARHLAEGHGLTWNVGEAPIEGYTNFLWTLYMAGLHLLPVPASGVSLLVMGTGVAVLLGLLVVVRDIAWQLSGGRAVPSIIAVAVLACHYPLVFWTLRGMEVGVMALFVYGAMAWAFRLDTAFSRSGLWAVAALLVLALLTRPDAVVPFALIALFLVMRVPAQHRLEVGGVLAASLLVPLAAQTLFRRVYYHDWLPNTYYLKVTGVSLLDRLSRGLKVWLQSYGHHLYPYMAAVPAALLARGLDPRVLLLVAFFLLQSAYSIYVGGDAWEWIGAANRYVTLGVPALAVLAGLGVDAVLRSAGPRVVALRLAAMVVAGAWAARAVLAVWPPAGAPISGLAWGLAAIVTGVVGWYLASWLAERLGNAELSGSRAAVTIVGLVLLIVVPANARMMVGWVTNNAIHVADDANATRLGLFVHETTRPDAVIAVRWAGAIPYFAGRTTLDLLGKSDSVIAKGPPATTEFFPGHNKWNFAYSIGQLQPDLVVQYEESPANNRDMDRWGYDRLPNGMWVRRDTTRVDRERVGLDWRDPAVLTRVLGGH